MKLFHKMFFTAFVGMMFVGNVFATDSFMQTAMKYGIHRKENINILGNPTSISGIVLMSGVGMEKLGYEKAGRVITEAGFVGEGYALTGGGVAGTCSAMGTDVVLHIGTDYFKGNETAKKLAKYAKADSSFGQHVWRTLASFIAGFLVDASLSDIKEIKGKIIK